MNARTPEAEMLKLGVPAATAWRHTLFALALLLPAIVWLYRDTAVAMVTIWSRSDTFAHAYTVPPIVAWLIWRQRLALAAVTPRPSAWLLLPLLLSGSLWLLGELSATNAATQLAFTATLVFTGAALIGRRAASVILFPLCFLFFAVPIGEFVMPQMMVWTADFTVFALRLSHIPVYREGLQFIIPSGNWSVVEACSGVRYLIASFMVGVLFAYLNYNSTWRRLVFAAVAIAVPVVANWVRAYMIVMLGHLSGNRLAVGADHLIYGWVFFGVVIVLMFMIGARWSEPELPAAPAAAGSAAAAALPVRHVWLLAAAAFALAALPPAAAWRLNRVGAGPAPQLAAPPVLGSGWRLVAQPPVEWKPAFENPVAELNSAFAAGGEPVGVYLGYYTGNHRQQVSESKLVSSNNVLVKSNDRSWAKIADGSARIETAGGDTGWRSATFKPSGGTANLVVWQLYWVDGHLTASDAMARIHATVARLRGHGDDAAVIVLYATEARPGDADTLLRGFARDNLGALESLLRQTRDTARDSARPSTEGEKK